MECLNCGRSLEESNRFCPDCGAAREARCHTCGATLAPDAHFCGACGAAVVVADAAAEIATGDGARERKVATMLFADIAGSTEFAERNDPEIVSRLISELFERLALEVERYGGTIEKFAGDALLAVFGVPVNHEDDPERAVRAALEMQSVAQAAAGSGSKPSLRIGVESGQVLADLARSTGERDLFVTGDAVNTASRLQAAAERGSVVVGPTTYAATRDLIEYDELAPQVLKGKELPVASWRAVRVKSRRGGVRAPLGLEASLIGRDEELRLLKDTIRKTVADGRPHLITVVGDAGVGKTRLVWELEKYLDGLPETFHWRKGRCYSYASVSYSPLVEAVKADAGIADDDAPEAFEAKLDARSSDLGVTDGDVSVGRAVRALVGVTDAGQLPRDELYEAWRLYLVAIAERHPLVLVMEDIHWADDVTLDFVEFIARWGDAPITLVCVARPELLERRESWGGGIRNAALVELGPLATDESMRMIDELLDGALPAEVRSRMISMAAGNPLFTEELVRMFVDQGTLRFADGRWQLVTSVERLTVPSSVQSVLSARLDELPAEEKRVAQEASVVGRIFWDVVVAHLREWPAEAVNERLKGLRVKELVQPRTPSTLAGAAEWAFHHVLVRDVAYESLPKADRGSLHLEVARWAEQQSADRGDEFAELIASHVSAALRYQEELHTDEADPLIADLRLATFTAARRAARRAAVVQDIATASRWQRTAIDQARRLGKPAIERAALADEYHAMVWHEVNSAERAEVHAEAVGLLEPVDALSNDELELWGRLNAHWAQAAQESGDTETPRTILREAAAVLAPRSPSPARARVLQTLGWMLWRQYEFAEARTNIDLALAEAEASGADDVYRWALHEAGVVTGFLGDTDESLRLMRQSYELAQAADDQPLLSRCYINIASTALNGGYGFEEALQMLDLGLARARRASAYGTIAFVGDNRCHLHYFMGEFEAMIELADEAMDAARRAGFHPIVAMLYRTRFDALRALGRLEEAEVELDEAVEQWVDEDLQHYQWLLISQSVRDLATQPAAAVERLSRPHPELQGYPNAEVQMALWLARIAWRVGDAAGLRRAVALQDQHATVGGPAHRLGQAWVQALIEDDEAALVALAPRYEELLNHVYAVDLLSDAALLALRRGDGDAAVARAQAAADELGYHPMLGPLPESRWAEGAPES